MKKLTLCGASAKGEAYFVGGQWARFALFSYSIVVAQDFVLRFGRQASGEQGCGLHDCSQHSELSAKPKSLVELGTGPALGVIAMFIVSVLFLYEIVLYYYYLRLLL